jgi:hypothetical protein
VTASSQKHNYSAALWIANPLSSHISIISEGRSVKRSLQISTLPIQAKGQVERNVFGNPQRRTQSRRGTRKTL